MPIPARDAGLFGPHARSDRGWNAFPLPAGREEERDREKQRDRALHTSRSYPCGGCEASRHRNISRCNRFFVAACGGERRSERPGCIFLLTFGATNLIYESRCDLFEIANLMSRENRSMKNATKKAAKKKAAPKKKK
jgi:hypothetical protein